VAGSHIQLSILEDLLEVIVINDTESRPMTVQWKVEGRVDSAIVEETGQIKVLCATGLILAFRGLDFNEPESLHSKLKNSLEAYY